MDNNGINDEKLEMECKSIELESEKIAKRIAYNKEEIKKLKIELRKQKRKDTMHALVLFAEMVLQEMIEIRPYDVERIKITDPKTHVDYTDLFREEIMRIKLKKQNKAINNGGVIYQNDEISNKVIRNLVLRMRVSNSGHLSVARESEQKQ